MLRRLGLGLLKGLLIGGAIGAGLHFGLRWVALDIGVLPFLIAMGAAGTTGIFAGRLPWREGAYIEGALKGAVGVGLGGLGYFGLTYLTLTFAFPGAETPVALAHVPLLFAPLLAGAYGALVELDNTGRGLDGRADGPSARADTAALDLDLLEAPATSPARKKKSSAAPS